ncbi:hypothetical protein BJX96DRAFT_149063 [Aspergillus floccosus]
MDKRDTPLCFVFVETVVSEIDRLSSQPTNAVTNSITAAIAALPDPDPGLEYVQALLFEAARSSFLEPNTLANVTRQLIDNLPAPSDEKFEKGIASKTRERWKGPNKPAHGEEISEYIENWVYLNRFVAHLTQLHVPLGDYGLWTLDRAFNPQAGGYREDERAYHVPAAAAWIDILGAEMYRWSGEGQWEQWKRGFEAVCQSSDAFPADTREQAQMAFGRMREVEESGGREA